MKKWAEEASAHYPANGWDLRLWLRLTPTRFHRFMLGLVFGLRLRLDRRHRTLRCLDDGFLCDVHVRSPFETGATTVSRSMRQSVRDVCAVVNTLPVLKLGFIEYNGGLKVNHSLLTVIVHD